MLDADGLTALLAMAWHARIAAPADGLLLALDQDARHATANFGGMADRFARVVYVDRIVMARMHVGAICYAAA
nr:hypothetical protein [Xanthomonas axonopodis]WVK06339.1 hypothetical protein KWH09_20525 [Xanthomonas campestris pv. olitorii]